MELGHILAWIVFGFIVGVIGRLLMPGRDPMGWVATTFLGIIGSIVGGLIAYSLQIGTTVYAPGSWLMSILGAIIALAIYRQSQTRRRI
jgi:uncharacterized membrane protein YeaQ/YmgE (transglycosylase-associated protein family)